MTQIDNDPNRKLTGDRSSGLEVRLNQVQRKLI